MIRRSDANTDYGNQRPNAESLSRGEGPSRKGRRLRETLDRQPRAGLTTYGALAGRDAFNSGAGAPAHCTKKIGGRLRHRIMPVAFVGGLLVASCLFAAEKREGPINVDGNGVALQGYDPIAYFVDGGPRKGEPRFAVTHSGALWLFSNEANRRRFEQDPEHYIPAFGGYCAYGVAQGYLAGIDPTAWAIIDDRLYLNCSDSIHDMWLADVAGNNKKADANWSRLTGQAVR